MSDSVTKQYDVAIIGGGIVGAANLYVLSRYTDIPSIVLLEKESEVGQVTSNSKNNSQTIHFGDIETNYNLEKAKKVKEAGEMLTRYLFRLQPRPRGIFELSHKMLLGVGKDEVMLVEKRFSEFKDVYPKLRLIYKDGLAELEPKVVEGRRDSEPIVAMVSPDGYVADFGKVTRSFVSSAALNTDKTIDIFTDTKVSEIMKIGTGYLVTTNNLTIEAKAVIVAGGAYSFAFARKLGYGQDKIILPIAGNFYPTTKPLLRGKVYTIIDAKLPFAAIHGDPNVHNKYQTKFGPTAYFLPVLERRHWGTLWGYLKTLPLRWATLATIIHTIFTPVRIKFFLYFLSYGIPFLGRRFFMRTVHKIVPTIQIDDFNYKKGLGGMRPIVASTITHEFEGGTAEIVGDNIIFVVTPSPGATACLQIAEHCTKQIIDFLKVNQFDEQRFIKDLKTYPT